MLTADCLLVVISIVKVDEGIETLIRLEGGTLHAA